jgi:membrane-bound ClpP family serine protease
MNTPHDSGARSYRLSIIINASVGGLLLLLGLVGLGVELATPSMRGDWAMGFLPGAVICLSVALAHRRTYVSLSR